MAEDQALRQNFSYITHKQEGWGKTVMTTSRVHLKDGSDWAEHEYYLVGDEAGLRNLMSACEQAIENGEARREDLGDYAGVKCLSSAFFEKPDEVGSSFETGMLVVMVVLAVVLMLIGLYTVGTWLF